jgi:hypothetical protein
MRIAGNSGRRWTAKEDERLQELAASGASLPEIAEKLNRTEPSTKTRAYILRVTLGRFGSKRRGLTSSAEGEGTEVDGEEARQK